MTALAQGSVALLAPIENIVDSLLLLRVKGSAILHLLY